MVKICIVSTDYYIPISTIYLLYVICHKLTIFLHLKVFLMNFLLPVRFLEVTNDTHKHVPLTPFTRHHKLIFTISSEHITQKNISYLKSQALPTQTNLDLTCFLLNIVL